MACTKHSMKKRVDRIQGEVCRKESKEQRESRKNKMLKCRPGTKVLREICKFQKSTELLIHKISMFQVVREILQKGTWLCIQASAVLAIHEATKAYLLHLLEDANLCAIHTKCVKILPNDMQLVRHIRGEV